MAREAGLAFRKSGNAMPRSGVHKMLRNRIYMGESVWGDNSYQRGHEPIVSRELWEKVQAVLDGRHTNRNRKNKRDFAFAGLIRCGHCGCAMVAEKKNSCYLYYHRSRAKGKCPEPYTREEVLEERFAELLDRLRFVLSNGTRKDGQLTAEYRQPFDWPAKNVVFSRKRKAG